MISNRFPSALRCCSLHCSAVWHTTICRPKIHHHRKCVLFVEFALQSNKFEIFGLTILSSTCNRFAKIIMKFVFGMYMTVMMIVLLNLLIAMMSNTYQRIDLRSDIEWKFGRAKLIRNMTR